MPNMAEPPERIVGPKTEDGNAICGAGLKKSELRSDGQGGALSHWAALFDPAAAEDDFARVEDGALSRCDGALRVVEAHLDAVRTIGSVERGGGGGVPVADLHFGPQGRPGSHPSDGNPIHLFGHQARTL